MSAPTSGLARITVRAPRRRLDLAIPQHVPLAELLPEVLRRAGEIGVDLDATQPAGGWMLRRGDGASLTGEVALIQQGVRDGDVLYLVPRNLNWPEPGYDDVIEEIAAGSRRRGRLWDASATRLFSLVAAALILLTGLGMLFATGPDRVVPGLVAAAICVVLLGAGSLLARALGDGTAGAAVAGLALPYAIAAGGLLAAGGRDGFAPDQLIVAASALLLAAIVGATTVGQGLRVFTAGVVVAIFGVLAGLLGLAVSSHGAAAILVVALTAGIGLAPLLAVRLGRLPLPLVTGSAEAIATEARPDRTTLNAVVARADEILAGCLLGISLVATGCVATLAMTSGVAGPLLAGLASTALLLRARVFPGVAARLPLLASGLAGAAMTGWAVAASIGPATRFAAVALGLAAVIALVATAASAHRPRPAGGSPYLGRLADIADVVAVVALAPVAIAVLGLFGWVRGLGN